MTETVQLEQVPEANTTRLCTAQSLVYKAYKRPYTAGGTVVMLLASGYYNSAPWQIAFNGVVGDETRYELKETVPGIQFFITTFYAPCYCSMQGLIDIQDTVTIVDSYGEHVVRLEEFCE